MYSYRVMYLVRNVLLIGEKVYIFAIDTDLCNQELVQTLLEVAQHVFGGQYSP